MFAEDGPAARDGTTTEVTGIIAAVDFLGYRVIRRQADPEGTRTVVGQAGLRIDG